MPVFLRIPFCLLVGLFSNLSFLSIVVIILFFIFYYIGSRLFFRKVIIPVCNKVIDLFYKLGSFIFRTKMVFSGIKTWSEKHKDAIQRGDSLKESELALTIVAAHAFELVMLMMVVIAVSGTKEAFAPCFNIH